MISLSCFSQIRPLKHFFPPTQTELGFPTTTHVKRLLLRPQTQLTSKYLDPRSVGIRTVIESNSVAHLMAQQGPSLLCHTVSYLSAGNKEGRKYRV